MKKGMFRDILFLDVETASGVRHYSDLPERLKLLWNKKAQTITKNLSLNREECIQVYDEKAAIYAEFNKIICISVGYLAYDEDEIVLKVKSYFGDNEKEILKEFSSLLNVHYNNLKKYYLCGHNIKEFDCPVICRRMLIHDLELPKLLNLSRKKSWQVRHLIDTLEMWKFGDYKSYVSLDLLSAVLNISSPKTNLVGSMVSKVYWEENDIERIKLYCEQDVVTTVSVFLRLVQERKFDYVNFVSI
tara:strand:+ start:18 stop:752 length:735 start_codon:yes stop_codon:yes gene_type:complete